MVVVLSLLLVFLLASSSPIASAAAGRDEHELTAACSGHRVIPPHNGRWVPLYRHPGPCSPSSSSSTGPAKAAKPPPLADMLRHDQLRVDHIHKRLSVSEDVGVSKGAVVSEPPLRFEVAYLHDQPVIQVILGSESKQSSGEQQQQQSQLPGVVQTVVLDTASDVPWVQCHPRSDTDSAAAAYDPARSGTYAAVPCGSATCDQLGRRYAGGCVKSQCQYRVPSPNDSNVSSSSGTYGTDLLAVGANGTGITFHFGCSQGGGSSSLGLDNATAGIMALGGGPESLVSQAADTYGNAFSYCIPPPATTETTTRQPPAPGFFVLGLPPNVDASQYVVTPMLRYQRVATFYRVRLRGIAVNGELLNVTPSAFAAGAVLDSRTAITRLPPTAYRALREAFRGWMGAYYTAAPARGPDLDTCYDLTRAAFVVLTPRIELVFERGSSALELDRSGILFHGCLAFTSNRDDRMPGILGNVQQQTMEVLYDVGHEAVGFRRGAC